MPWFFKNLAIVCYILRLIKNLITVTLFYFPNATPSFSIVLKIYNTQKSEGVIYNS